MRASETGKRVKSKENDPRNPSPARGGGAGASSALLRAGAGPSWRGEGGRPEELGNRRGGRQGQGEGRD